MTSYVCRYPDGAPGFALLSLRCCLGFVAFGVAMVLASGAIDARVLHVVAGLVALLLAIGLAARPVALVLGVSTAVALAMPGTLVQALLLAGALGGCAMIVLAGPGAFSVDARLHGRRVIHLQATPDRGGDD
ncbi:MAG TPA: hypothetical protein VM619_05105 [Luteimonas sp.]|nr:hypothetical protein [Luteimonas sp.]